MTRQFPEEAKARTWVIRGISRRPTNDAARESRELSANKYHGHGRDHSLFQHDPASQHGNMVK